MNKLVKSGAALIGMLMTNQAHAISITAYSSDFDGATTVAAGVTANLAGAAIQSVQGYSGLGPSGNQFGGNFLSSYGASGQATLTLTNLPGHTSLDITSLLAIIDSWDSSGGGCCAPDFFQIRVDGATIFSDTYAIASGSIHNTQGLTDIGAGNQQRGFTSWNDAAFNLENELQNITHTASSLTIDFLGTGGGWQGGTDEAWGIDNLLVTLNGVTPPVTGIPEPITLSLLGAGLLGLGAIRRRRD